MRILLNGDPHELPGRLTVAALLERLAIDPRLVAVELNRVVVKRERYGDTAIDDGAEVEIVAFVGGGSRTGSRPASGPPDGHAASPENPLSLHEVSSAYGSARDRGPVVPVAPRRRHREVSVARNHARGS